MVEVLSPIVDPGCMCIALRTSLFWIWNDDSIWRKQVITTSGCFPPS